MIESNEAHIRLLFGTPNWEDKVLTLSFIMFTLVLLRFPSFSASPSEFP